MLTFSYVSYMFILFLIPLIYLHICESIMFEEICIVPSPEWIEALHQFRIIRSPKKQPIIKKYLKPKNNEEFVYECFLCGIVVILSVK